METLNVFLLDKLAGYLESDNGKLSFRYAEKYLEDKNAIPLSFSMPLQKESFDNQLTATFFDNLLPPDTVRKKLGKILHLSRRNIFGFLKAIGGDCAGAISLYPSEIENNADFQEQPHLRELSNEEAVEILTGLHRRPLNIGKENGFRISGTGAQDKLIACVSDGKIFLPLFGEPSTHIIKVPIKDYPHSVFNELFCMKLAEKMKFPTPDCDIFYLNNIPYYCVKRYDRKIANGKNVRLHQEDFCQLFSVDPEKKYENEGGPTVSVCFNLLKKVHIDIAGQIDFLRRIIFNFLIGNGDAHAKNFSVLYKGKTAYLAPVYDLLCTEVYDNLSHESAMSIGHEFNFAEISRQNFSNMAVECDIRAEIVMNQIEDLIRKIVPAATELANELNIKYPCPIYNDIIQIIKHNAMQLTVKKQGCVLNAD